MKACFRLGISLIFFFLIFAKYEVLAQCYSPVVYPTPNQALRYSLDNNLTDGSGLGNNAVLVGSPTFVTDRFGNANYAISISGSSQSVTNTSLVTSIADFTLSIWIKTNTSVGGWIVGRQNGSSHDRKIFMNDNGIVKFGIYNGNVQTIASLTSLNDDKWHHILATHSTSASGTIALYVDNVLQSSASLESTDGNTGNWVLGNGSNWAFTDGITNGSTSSHFEGTIDDFVYYTRVVSAAERLALYSPFVHGTSQISSSVCAGGSAILSINTIVGTVTGYRWRYNNAFISGGIYSGTNTSSLTITGVPSTLTGSFSLTATGVCGNFTTSGTTLTITAATFASNGAANISTCQGLNLSFPLQSIAGSNLSYQWLKDDVGITNNATFTGTNTSVLGINSASAAQNANYKCILTGDCGVYTTSGFDLTILPTTSITGITSNQGVSTCEGGNFTIAGSFISGSNVKYQWLSNGTPILAGFGGSFTTTGLEFLSAVSSLGGVNYSLSASGFCGSMVSNPVNPIIGQSTSATNAFGSILNTCVGSSFSLSLSNVRGVNNTYLWFQDGNLITSLGTTFSNITSSGLGFVNLPVGFSGTFSGIVSGDCDVSGPISVSGTYISVNDITSIVGLANLNLDTCPGTSLVLSPTSVSGAQLGYSWLKNGIAINGGTDSGIYGNTFSTSGLAFNATPGLSGNYLLSVTGLCGVSSASGLSLITRSITGAINIPISAVSYCSGSNRTFQVNTTSGYGLSLAWGYAVSSVSGIYTPFSNGNSIAGLGGLIANANTRTLSITGMPDGLDGYVFNVTATGYCGLPVVSNDVLLDQIPTTTILGNLNYNLNTCQPNSTFTIPTSFSGQNLSFRWLRNGLIINSSNASGNTISNYTTSILGIDINNNNLDGNTFAISVSGTCGIYDGYALGSFYTLNLQSGVGSTASPAVNYTITTCLGSAIQINVVASGNGLIYEWWKGTNTVSGTKLTTALDGGIYANVTSSGSGITSTLNITTVTSTLNGVSFFTVFKTSCGNSISASAMIVVNTVPSIISQPSDFSACPDYPSFAAASIVGSPPMSFIWQTSTTGWNNLINGADYQNVTTSTLSLPTSPSSLTGYRYRLIGSNACGTVTTNGVTFTSNTIPYADFFGLKPKYCSNGAVSNLTSASNFTFPGGTFLSNPSIPGLLSSTSISGVYQFNPSVVSLPSAINVSYITPSNGSGCVTTVTYATFVNTVDAVDFYSPSITQYIYKSGTVVDLQALPSVGGIGAFAGTGVIGNKFYVDLINSIGNTTVNFNFTNTLTGCSNGVSKSFNIQNNFDKFKYTPVFPDPDNRPFIGGIKVNNRFCIDDNSLYAISFTGITPEDNNLQFNAADKVISAQIAFLEGGTTGSIIATPELTTTSFYFSCIFPGSIPIQKNDRKGFKLIPSSLPGANVYNLRYFLNQNASYCPNNLLYNRINYPLNAAPQFNEQVTIVGLSPAPFSTLQGFTVCGGFNSTILSNIATNVVGTNIEWYYLTTPGVLSSAVLVSFPGFNASSPTLANLNSVVSLTGASGSDKDYDFRIVQNTTGCKNLTQSTPYLIKILDKPDIPIPVSSLTVSGCVADPSISTVLTVQGVPGRVTQWYDDVVLQQRIISSTNYRLDLSINTEVARSYNYYVTMANASCQSSPLVFTIKVDPIPFDAGGNSIVFDPPAPYCLNTTSVVSVAGFTASFDSKNIDPTQATEFQWYSNGALVGTSYVTSTVPGLQPGAVVYKTVFNSSYTNATVASIDLYTKMVYSTTQCKSSSSNINKFIVNDIPKEPTISASGLKSNVIGPLCQTVDVPILVASSQSIGPVFTWYFNSSLTGSSFVGSNFNPNITTTTSAAIDVTYYVTQKVNGCEGPSNYVNVLRNAEISVPGFVFPNPSYFCTNQPTNVITAIGISNSLSGINWYRNSVNQANLLAYNDFYVPPVSSIAGIDSLLITQKIILDASTGSFCESFPRVISFVYRKTPQAPLVRDTAFCEGSPLPIVFITGDSLNRSPLFKWYARVGGSNVLLNNGTTIVGSGVVFNRADLSWSGTFSGASRIISDTTFYVTQSVNGCESPIDSIKYLSVKKPFRPSITSTQLSYCSGDLLKNLGSSISPGARVKWYLSSISGRVLSDSSNIYTTSLRLNNSIVGYNLTSSGIGLDSLSYKIYLTQTLYNILRPKLNFKGCESNADSVTIKVFPIPPVPKILSLSPAYCGGSGLTVFNYTSVGLSDPSLQLNWYGTSGTNLKLSTSSEFTPFGFNSNPSPPFADTTRFYARQTIKGCESAPAFVDLFINPLPSISISGLNSQYCVDSDDITLTGYHLASTSSTVGSFFSLNTNAFTNISSGRAIIRPKDMESDKSYSISYRVLNEYNCPSTFTGTFKVNPLPLVSYSKVGNSEVKGLDSTICQNAPQFDLSPSPLGGIFVVNSTPLGSNFSFIPSSFSLGNQFVAYNYTNPLTGCTNSFSSNTSIVGVPIANFTLSTFCTDSTVLFKDLSTLSTIAGSTIDQYEWRGINYTFGSTSSAPSREPFSKFGSYITKLSVTSNYGCSATTTIGYNIGRKPDIVISYSKICADQNTQFIDVSSLLGAAGYIVSKEWDFGNGFVTFAGSSFQYKFPTLGANQVRYKVTSEKGCTGDTSFIVNILPVVDSISYPSIFSFDTDSSGWYSSGKNRTWDLGNYPNSQLTKGINDNFWLTSKNNGTYNNLEDSYIYSPCFNFAVLSRPMVSLDYASDNFRGVDGGVLQFSLDDGSTWEVLGDIGSGINWYNQKDLTANPGAQSNFNLGWSGTTYEKNGNRWVNARHSLDVLEGKSNVRFRLGFGAIEQISTFSGFAFDNFKIGSRSKTVLLENFVNAFSDVSIKNSTVAGFLLNKYKKDAIAINYHTSFPFNEPFNTANPADPGARVLFYGIESVPRTLLNGNQPFGISSATQLLSDTAIVKRSLQQPLFDIDITTFAGSGTEFNVSANFKALADYKDTSPLLVGYVTVVERDVTNIVGANGVSTFDWVTRKMLPNAAGTVLYDGTSKVNSGDTKLLSQSWTPTSAVANTANLGAVAFIQDVKTKEILQSKYIGPKMYVASVTGNIPTTSITKPLTEKDVLVYPNPTSGEINIQFNRELSKDISYVVYDLLGNVLESGKITKDISLKKIDANDYPSGIYFLRIDGLIKKVTVMK